MLTFTILVIIIILALSYFISSLPRRLNKKNKK